MNTDFGTHSHYNFEDSFPFLSFPAFLPDRNGYKESIQLIN